MQGSKSIDKTRGRDRKFLYQQTTKLGGCLDLDDVECKACHICICSVAQVVRLI